MINDEQKGDLVARIQFMGKTKEEFNSFASDVVSKLHLAENDSTKNYYFVVLGTINGQVKNQIELYNLIEPVGNLPQNISKKHFDRLVEWLCCEYPKEDAIDQLKNALYVWEGTNLLTITYNNGMQDKVLFEENTIQHLNPH